jgi:hypothetical protein
MLHIVVEMIKKYVLTDNAANGFLLLKLTFPVFVSLSKQVTPTKRTNFI